MQSRGYAPNNRMTIYSSNTQDFSAYYLLTRCVNTVSHEMVITLKENVR